MIECKYCGLLDSTCDGKSDGCCDKCTHIFKGKGAVKTDKKPMTVEEIAEQVANNVFAYTTGGSQFENKIQEEVKKALLTFAAQEAEPLVEALERNANKTVTYEGIGHHCEYRKEFEATKQRSAEALTTHRLRYPKK